MVVNGLEKFVHVFVTFVGFYNQWDFCPFVAQEKKLVRLCYTAPGWQDNSNDLREGNVGDY